MEMVIVLTGNYREFVDFVQSRKNSGMYDINSLKESHPGACDWNRAGAYAVINGIKYKYFNDPNMLLGIERGTKYITTGTFYLNKCLNHEVMLRFNRSDFV